MIEARNISKSFDGKSVLEGVSLVIEKGKCTALTGASGRGKTTLMRILAGLLEPDSGEVIYRERPRFSFVFQENRLLEHRTVIDNILTVQSDRERAEYFLVRTGLYEDRNKKASDLSGGMKRRLAVARALAYGGELYFLDEPLRELDGETLRAVAEVIKEEIAGKTAVLITHDEFSSDFLSDIKIEV